jgi:hypothetical protein
VYGRQIDLSHLFENPMKFAFKSSKLVSVELIVKRSRVAELKRQKARRTSSLDTRCSVKYWKQGRLLPALNTAITPSLQSVVGATTAYRAR